MSVYSLMGALLMLTGGYLSATWLNRRVEARLDATEAMLELLRYTERQIDGFLMSAPQLLARCDPELLRRCGWHEASPPDSFDCLLRRGSCADRETAERMTDFASEFGRQYREGQLSECRRYIEWLEERRSRQAKELLNDRRLHYTLCLTVAAVAVVLLW